MNTLQEKYDRLAADAKKVIRVLLKKHRDDYPAVYEMYQNPGTSESIVQMILDYYTGGAVTYTQAIHDVEIHFKRLDFTD